MPLHGTANIPSSGKILNVVQAMNLKYTQGWGVFCSSPIKAHSDASPSTLPRLWVINQAIIPELWFKELLTLQKELDKKHSLRGKTVCSVKSASALFLRLEVSTSALKGFVFHFISRSLRRPFGWMWSVWKHCMKYLCILWFWWHKKKRSIVAVQEEQRSLEKKLLHLCQVFEVILTSF